MRSWTVLALVAGALLAGCGDNGDGDTTTNTVTRTTTTTNTTTGPPPVPNVKPTLVLTTRVGENVTNVTTVGMTVAFDGTGSADSDGTLTNLAVIVDDGNQTRFASLLENGRFLAAEFLFDRPGVVNVTLNGIDDDGATVTLLSHVYVNHPQDIGTHGFNGGVPAGTNAGCTGPVAQSGGSNVVDPTFYRQFTFDVRRGATFVEVVAAVTHAANQGGVSMIICDPEGNAISAVGSDDAPLMTNPDTVFMPSLDYYVAVLSRAPGTSVVVTGTVHYEPPAPA